MSTTFGTRKFYPLFKKTEGEDKALELRQIRLHDLGHSYASLMLQQGESVTYVKEQMGIIRSRSLLTSTSILFPAKPRCANRLEAHILPTSQAIAAVHA